MSQQSRMQSLPPVTLASLIVSAVLYPIDIVRALKMASSSGSSQTTSELIQGFYKQHGLKGIVSQGMVAELSRATLSRSLKFFLQPIVHEVAFSKKEQQGSPWTKGLAGAIATIPEVIAISPFENAKLAKQLDKEKKFGGLFETLKHLKNKKGIHGGLYAGYFGMQTRQCLWTGGFFLTLDYNKSLVQDTLGFKSPFLKDVLSGFFAGLFGTLLNTWCDVARTALQKQVLMESLAENCQVPKANLKFFVSGVTGFFGQAKQIVQTRGFGALYLGAGVKAVYMGGSGSLLAVLVPRFKQLWGVKD